MIKIVLFMLCAGIASAETTNYYSHYFQTLNGEPFSEANITKLNDVYAIVTDSGGGKKVPFTNLPTEICRALRYDPVAAQAEIDRENQIKQEQERQRELAIHARQMAANDRSLRYVNDQLVHVYDFTNLRGNISQVLSNGVLFVPFVRRAAPRGYVNYSQSIGGSYIQGASPGGDVEVPGDKTVFIRCPTEGLVDGQKWDCLAFPVGIFTYQTVLGSEATVKKYDTGLSYSSRSDVVLHRDAHRW